MPGYPPLSGYVVAPPPPPVAPGGAPLADAWERLVAYLVDMAVLAALELIPLALVALALWSRFEDAIDRISAANQQSIDGDTSVDPFRGMGSLFHTELLLFAIVLPATLVISYLYMVTFMHSTGQTLGKRIMKIKVVRAADGAGITLTMARKRWLVAQPSATFAPYFSYADSLWLLWDKPYRQCLHDKCAETVVVKIKP
jgi:uncharacterized RDD family membrane protein YckC